MTENIRELAAQANEIEALRMEVAEWKGIAVAQSAEIERLRAEVSELRAARIAYASEFPEAKDGGPDTGNIHTNIRSLKARAERLAEALREVMLWIENWSPPFTEDDEWPDTEAKAQAALHPTAAQENDDA